MKNFNIKNGLPSNEVYFLHEDRKGYIWICTDAGIARYNGSQFKVFNSSNGLPDNTVFEVKEDAQGKIWFRTFSGEIGYITNDSVHTIKASEYIGKYIKEGIVNSFSIDKNFHLIIGRTSIDTCSFLEITPPYRNENIKEIWKDKTGQKGIKVILLNDHDYVFADSRGDAKVYYTKVFTREQKLIYSDSLLQDGNPIFTRVSVKNNELLIISNSYLQQINIASGKGRKHQYEKSLVSAFRISSNKIAIGEREKGLSFANNNLDITDETVDFNGMIVTHVIKDYQKGYWYSTAEAGIFYLPFQSSNYMDVLSDPHDRVSRIFNINDTALLIGTAKGKLIYFYQSWRNTYHWNTIYSDEKGILGAVYASYQTKPLQFIVSGALGTIEFNLINKQVKPLWRFSNGYYACIKFIEYHNSLICLSRAQWFITNKTNYDNYGTVYANATRLTSIAYNRADQKIYVGTLKAMHELNLRTNVIDTTKLIGSRIEDLFYKDSLMLIATRTKGLIIKAGNKFDTINEKKGLISDLCNSVTMYDDIIWVNTNKGLSKITYYDAAHYYIQNYPLSSFLDPNYIGSMQVMKNKLWFTSDTKLFNFDLYNHNAPSRFYIESIIVNGTPKPSLVFAELKPNENSVEFKYSALFYNANRNIKYRYKINAEDSVWNYTNTNEIKFANLSPGLYKFIIEAQNLNGNWIKADRNVVFVIKKPFYQTVWFFIVVVIIVSAAIGLGIRWWYLRALRKQAEANELQLLIYDLETKAIKAQMNPHFIFNSLNTIQQFILSNDTDNAYNYLSKFAKLVRKLLESNTTKSIILEEELDILKRYMEIEALRFEEVFEYSIEIIGNMNVAEKRIPHMLIQPFVENAIWHGLLPQKGDKKLVIRIAKQSEKILICEVEDNGVGRPDKKESNLHLGKSKSLAVDYINERLNLLGKQLNLNLGVEITDKKENNLKTGTLVRITIPILKN